MFQNKDFLSTFARPYIESNQLKGTGPGPGIGGMVAVYKAKCGQMSGTVAVRVK